MSDALRGVFFDAGETLVHPHPSFAELLASALRDRGHDVDLDELRHRMSAVADHFTDAARRRELWTVSPERSKAFWGRVYRSILGDLGIGFDDALGDALYATFTELANYRLFDDVAPVLERLRRDGLVLGVISNFEEWLERLLESLRVSVYFDVRVISGLEGVEKPDPAIFRLALDRAGLRPDEAAYVGDSPEFDVVPAMEVGLKAILIDRRARYPDHAGTRIRSMAELPAALARGREEVPR